MHYSQATFVFYFILFCISCVQGRIKDYREQTLDLYQFCQFLSLSRGAVPRMRHAVPYSVDDTVFLVTLTHP